MSAPRPSLLVSGTLTLDSTRRRGEEVMRVPGGSALYASLAASLTLPVRVVGTVGSDFDLGALSNRHGWGIDTRAIEVIPGRTFEWSAEYSDDGDTRTTRARVPGVEAGRVPSVPHPATASDALLLASANPRVQSAVLAACPHVVNVGLDSMTHWWREEAEALRALLGRVQVLFLNEEELAAATQGGDPEQLLALGPTMVVVKCGSHGAWLYQRGTGRVRVAAVSARVVDPTGAGDAFAGAFMAACARGMASDLSALLRHAALVGAFAVEGVGAAGLMEAAKPGVVEERQRRAEAGR